MGRDPAIASLLSASREAVRMGDKPRAHELLQQAATLDPYDETIWWSLLEVVNTEEDRKTCLENVLALNPNSLEARRLLRMSELNISMVDLTPPIPAKSLSEIPAPKSVRPLGARKAEPAPKPRLNRRPLILWAVVFIILAVALAVVLSIIIYGFA